MEVHVVVLRPGQWLRRCLSCQGDGERMGETPPVADVEQEFRFAGLAG